MDFLPRVPTGSLLCDEALQPGLATHLLLQRYHTAGVVNARQPISRGMSKPRNGSQRLSTGSGVVFCDTLASHLLVCKKSTGLEVKKDQVDAG